MKDISQSFDTITQYLYFALFRQKIHLQSYFIIGVIELHLQIGWQLQFGSLLFSPFQVETLVEPFDVASVSLHTIKPDPSLDFLFWLLCSAEFPEFRQTYLKAAGLVDFGVEVGVDQNVAVDLPKNHVFGFEDILHLVASSEENRHHRLFESEAADVAVEALNPDGKSLRLMMQICLIAEIRPKYLITFLLLWILLLIISNLLLDLCNFKLQIKFLILQDLQTLVLQFDLICHLLLIYLLSLLIDIQTFDCALLTNAD